MGGSRSADLSLQLKNPPWRVKGQTWHLPPGDQRWSCTPLRQGHPGLPWSACSDQAPLRRPGVATYRCFLPDLTGFVGSRRAGPNLHCRSAMLVSIRPQPQRGIRPRYSGLRVQGTASSPSSTTVYDSTSQSARCQMAERVGFEPTVHCCTHDFHSCRFGRSRTSPGSTIISERLALSSSNPMPRAVRSACHRCQGTPHAASLPGWQRPLSGWTE
jgi:hypothetical protein